MPIRPWSGIQLVTTVTFGIVKSQTTYSGRLGIDSPKHTAATTHNKFIDAHTKLLQIKEMKNLNTHTVFTWLRKRSEYIWLTTIIYFVFIIILHVAQFNVKQLHKHQYLCRKGIGKARTIVVLLILILFIKNDMLRVTSKLCIHIMWILVASFTLSYPKNISPVKKARTRMCKLLNDLKVWNHCEAKKKIYTSKAV